METVADIIIVLFWVVFFVATVIALIGHATGKYMKDQEDGSADWELEDDDPVFLFESHLEEY